MIYLWATPLKLLGQFHNIDLSEKIIKLSGDYKWAEYPSRDREESVVMARKSLIEKISTTITSTTRQSVEETNTSISDSFQSTTSTFSLLKLNGVDFITTQKRDRSFLSLAFISNSDLQKSLDISRENQIENWKKIEGFNNQNRTTQQLPDLLEAYYQTYTYPGNVYVSTSNGDSAIVKNLLKSELDRILQDLNIVAKPAKGGVFQNIIDVRVEFEVKTKSQELMDGVMLRPQLPNYAFQDVYDGLVEVSLDRLPSSVMQNLIIEIRPKSRNTELSTSLSNVTPFNEISIPIDYSGIIDLDVEIIELAGEGFRLSPKATHLTVNSVVWRINDQTVSTRPLFTILKSQLNEGDILELKINSDSKLQKKYRHQNGRFSPYEVHEGAGQIVLNQSKIADSGVATNQQKPNEIQTRTDSSIIPAPNYSSEDRSTSTLENSLPNNSTSPSETAITPLINEVDVSTLVLPTVIQEISEIRNARLLLMKLRELRSRDLLMFGNENEVISASMAFVAIIDPRLQILIDFLSPEQSGNRISMLNKSKITSISQTYKGYGAIYITVY